MIKRLVRARLTLRLVHVKKRLIRATYLLYAVAVEIKSKNTFAKQPKCRKGKFLTSKRNCFNHLEMTLL